MPSLRQFSAWNTAGVTLLLSLAVLPHCRGQVFQTLKPAISEFWASTLPNIPLTTLVTGNGTFTRATVGYQSGDLMNGKVLYYPWQVLPPGATGGMSGALAGGIPQGTIVSYNLDGGGAFNKSGSWTFFDLTTLINSPPNIAAGYNGAAVARKDVYLVPSAANSYPVFVAYDTSQPLDEPKAYLAYAAPPRGGPLGPTYGWCGGVYDGRFVYYVPGQDQTLQGDPHHGNVLRFDTTANFNPLSRKSGWAWFDMAAQVNPLAKGFQSGVYDGYRFVYFIPDTNHLIVRYDTQYHTPGTPDPSAFTTPAAYKVFDPTTLGSPGAPPVTGLGSVANLVGFTGGVVAWDAAHANEYLYFVPWAIYPDGLKNAYAPTLESTTARVLIGTMRHHNWTYVDVTGTDEPETAPPNWEIFDLNSLTANPQWAANGWPTVHQAGPLTGQSAIAGFQLGFLNTASGWPRVGFGADMSLFWVEHDLSHALSDPAGWYVARKPYNLPNGTMGGAYDAINQVFYPSSPTCPLYQVSGL